MKSTLTLFTIGLAIAANAQWTTYDVSNSGIATNTIYRANVDPSNGDVLVSTGSGLNILSGSTWALHNMASGALGHNAAIMPLRDGNNLWITTDGGGVSRYNGSSWTIFNTSNSAISDNRIYEVKKAPSGVIWFGTRDGGLCSYNGSSFNTISVNGNISATYDRVMGLAIDASGVLWIGTAGGGLAKFNPNTNQWSQYNTVNSTILHNDVYTVAMAPDGKIWCGTFGGLSIFDPNTSTFVSHLSTSNSIMADNYVRGIAFDNLGRGYVGSGYGGVCRVETNHTISTLWTSSNSNLASDTVWHLGYGNGTVWVATLNEGLSFMEIDVTVPEISSTTLDLLLYPVPSTGDVMMNVKSAHNTEIGIDVYGANGQLVWSATSVGIVSGNENRITIPMSQFARGAYSVVVTDEKFGIRSTKQIIRE